MFGASVCSADAPASPVYSPTERTEQTRRAKALRKRLETAFAAGAKHIRIAPGVYRFRNPLNLTGLDGVVIDAQGAEFVFTRGLVRMRSCRNTVLKDLFLDVAPLPVVQGWVVTLDPREYAIDFKVDPEYPMPPDNGGQERFRCAFFTPDGTRELPVIDTSTSTPLAVGPGALRIHTKRAFDLAGRTLRPGDRVVLSIRTGAGGISLTDCAGVTLENVTVYAAGRFAITENGYAEGGNIYRRCRIIRRPGTSRLMAGASDGFHSITQKKGPRLIECEIAHCFDDLVNIHGFFSLALERDTDGRWLIAGPYGQRFSPGSLVRFYRFPDAEPIGEARVLACELRNRPSGKEVSRRLAEHFRNTCPRLRMRSFCAAPAATVSFDRKVRLKPFDFIAGTEYCGAGACIERCRFHDGHVRGVLLKAPNSRVVHCRFERIARSGVVVAPEIYWLEGPFPRHLAIEGNTIVDCGFGALDRVEKFREFAPLQIISGFAPRFFPPLFSSAITMGAIVCKANRIVRAPGPGIFIMNAENVEISGNTIEAPGEKPGPMLDLTRNLPENARLTDAERDVMRRPYFGVLLANTRQVRLRDNRVKGGRGLLGRGWRAVRIGENE